MILKFINPANGYTEEYNTAVSPIWCFFFGSFYWLVRGNIGHAILSFALALLTFGISWLIYPFFANAINIKAYKKKGWISEGHVAFAIKEGAEPAPSPAKTLRESYAKGVAWRERNNWWGIPLSIVLGLALGIYLCGAPSWMPQ